MLCCKFEVLFDGGNQAESMVVVGDHEKLGAWDVSKAPKLKQVPVSCPTYLSTRMVLITRCSRRVALPGVQWRSVDRIC